MPESGDLANCFKPNRVGSHLLCLTKILTELQSWWDTETISISLGSPVSLQLKPLLVITK